MNTRDMTEQQRITWRTADFLERLPYLLPEGEYETLRSALGPISNEMAEFKQSMQYGTESDGQIDTALDMLAARCRDTAGLIRHPELYSIINYLHRAAMQCEKIRAHRAEAPRGENIIDFNAWRGENAKSRKPRSSGLLNRSGRPVRAARDGNVIYPEDFSARIANARSIL